MAKRWDSTLKRLLGEAPHDFVRWFKPDTQFDEELSPHLGVRNIDADILYRVRYARKRCIFHIEFQRRSSAAMPRRLWEYNTLAALKYHLPVYSIVIYLKKGRSVIESPYIQKLPWGEEAQHFTYRVIKLWEISAEMILNAGFEGLLPLVPLTDGGLRAEAIEQVITQLNPPGGTPKADLLSLAYILASLQSTNSDDRNRVTRSFAMIDDMLRESWVYKEWQQETTAKVTQQVTERVTQQVTQQVMKQNIIVIIQARFPSLVELTQKRLKLLNDSEQLQQRFVQIARAKDEEEARHILLTEVTEQS